MPYWVCFGSLLGAVREKQHPYQSIPWEHDFDLCFFEKDKERAFTALRQQLTLGNMGEDRIFTKSVWGNVARVYLDLYQFSEKGDRFECSEGGSEQSLPRDVILPFKDLQSCGRSMPGPNKQHESLVAIFGKNYLTPLWPSGLQRFMCKLYVGCELSQVPKQ